MAAHTRHHPYVLALGYAWSVGLLDWIPAVPAAGGPGGGDASAANQVAGNASLTSIDTKTPALGQALAAASTPVVLTAAQVTTLTPPAAIAGFALEAGHLAAIDTSVAKIPSQGQALAASSLPVVLTAAQMTTLTPLATVAANTTEVRPATATLSNLASSASSQQVLASTPTRRGAYFYNDSTTRCLIKLGTTASATSFTVPLVAGAYYELPVPAYSGRIDAIWDSANGNLRITELT
jgi:hypothetical protein